MASQEITIPGELGATIDHLEQRIRSMAAAANGLRKAFDG